MSASRSSKCSEWNSVGVVSMTPASLSCSNSWCPSSSPALESLFLPKNLIGVSYMKCAAPRLHTCTACVSLNASEWVDRRSHLFDPSRDPRTPKSTPSLESTGTPDRRVVVASCAKCSKSKRHCQVLNDIRSKTCHTVMTMMRGDQPKNTTQWNNFNTTLGSHNCRNCPIFEICILKCQTRTPHPFLPIPAGC